MEFIASQTGAQNIIRRASSRKRAATNLENKIAHSTNARDLFAFFPRELKMTYVFSNLVNNDLYAF